MTKQEFINYKRSVYKEVFGDLYDDNKALAQVEDQYDPDKSDDQLKSMVNSIAARVKSKLQWMDDECPIGKYMKEHNMSQDDFIYTYNAYIKGRLNDEELVKLYKDNEKIAQDLSNRLLENPNLKLFSILSATKLDIDDAPSEIKQAFNDVVEYFSKESVDLSDFEKMVRDKLSEGVSEDYLHRIIELVYHPLGKGKGKGK